MSDVKWISVSTDIFNDEKMCVIESMENGMIFELIWIKLLCLAGRCNANGFLYAFNDIPFTDEMLAKNFRISLDIVKQALDVFLKMGMIEIVDEAYMISNWMKHQDNTGLSHIREVNRLRQQRYRDKQKAMCNVTDNVTDDVTNNDFCSICNMSYVDVYKEVIGYLNEKTNSTYRYTTKKNQTLIHARCEEGFKIDDFKTVIDKKVEEWIGTEWEKYLRPETLFGTKFEGYLNQRTRDDGFAYGADSLVV